MAEHWTEDDLILYFYGEGRRRTEIEQHLQTCAACAATYRAITSTLAMVKAPDVPHRGDQYGLEVWQRIRHDLAERQMPWWMVWMQPQRLTLVAAAAVLLIAAFVAGRVWEHEPSQEKTVAANPPAPGPAPVDSAGMRRRILLTAVADHLDRSERVLTDVVNASSPGDISSEQGWADDLLKTSRLYRQSAADAGERSVVAVLDEIERSLLDIVNSPSPISAAELDNIRRRIDAAALLFKVRVMSDELRQREDVTARPAGGVRGPADRKTS